MHGWNWIFTTLEDFCSNLNIHVAYPTSFLRLHCLGGIGTLTSSPESWFDLNSTSLAMFRERGQTELMLVNFG
ncbi:hypothetical protein HNY73_002397 [Argiope bruennichi]|uniref:Uncharacterized protein n=1 Tax=Argiope bruennichi TaxID=94029 RepID=A0A8T0FTD9_ARGBR|nr:hypothetical protein HNY73_002397 [Argiope bruennichi]